MLILVLIQHNRIISLLTVLYPGISPPKFTGPHIITKTCNGNEVTDFTFECIVQYKPATDVDVAMFDVVLTFDGVVDESTLKTTTSDEKTVVFSSDDLHGHFGKKVNHAVCLNEAQTLQI